MGNLFEIRVFWFFTGLAFEYQQPPMIGHDQIPGNQAVVSQHPFRGLTTQFAWRRMNRLTRTHEMDRRRIPDAPLDFVNVRLPLIP